MNSKTSKCATMINSIKYFSLLLLTEFLINSSNINTLTFKKEPILVIGYSLTF
jgi:hypothetical protein